VNGGYYFYARTKISHFSTRLVVPASLWCRG